MRIITRTLTAAALLAATSCSSTVRTGNSPMFLVIDNIAGIRGAATASTPGAFLISDVFTNVTSGGSCTPLAPCPTVFGDSGQVTLELAKKNATSTVAPTTNNQVTITRVHIHYRLADGSAPVAGVTVPADIDTFSTATVPPSGTVTMSFELVRVSAKEQKPLLELRKPSDFPPPDATGGQIDAMADITFFGTDQVGNAISATGSIAIQFADWADN
jgi:hypothetical protein